MTGLILLTPQGLYLCPIPGCRGNIIWRTKYDRSICGICNHCNAGLTLLITELPKPMEAKTNELVN